MPPDHENEGKKRASFEVPLGNMNNVAISVPNSAALKEAYDELLKKKPKLTKKHRSRSSQRRQRHSKENGNQHQDQGEELSNIDKIHDLPNFRGNDLEAFGTSSPSKKFDLKDMITLVTLRQSSTYSSGVKKMLHAPTLRLMILKQSLIETLLQKSFTTDFLSKWAGEVCTGSPFFLRLEQVNWNSPEGFVSVFLSSECTCSLEDIITTAGMLSEGAVQSVASQVLQGLNFLHEKLGMAHLGIRPSQILLTRDGTVKVLSF